MEVVFFCIAKLQKMDKLITAFTTILLHSGHLTSKIKLKKG